jgi:hypothetical protein
MVAADEAIAGRLRVSLQKQSAKVLTLFREWDADGSGTVTLKEFRRGIGHLGIKVSREAIDQEFASFDVNGSGELELCELERALRPGQEMKMDLSLKPGAAGVIQTKAKNKTSRLAPIAASQTAEHKLNEQADGTLRRVISSSRTAPFGPRAKQSGGSLRETASPSVGKQNDGRPSQPSPSSTGQDVAEEDGELASAIAGRQAAPSVARLPARPPSRSNLSVSSRVTTAGSRQLGSPRLIKQVADDWDALDASLHRTSSATQKAAAVYACGTGARVALKYSTRAGSPRSMLLDDDILSSLHRSPSPSRPRSTHGSPPRERLGSGGGSLTQLSAVVGSQEELEAALRSAQTALVMAMERESSLAAQNNLLEDENRAMREQFGRRTSKPVQVTEQKLQNARRMLEGRLITDSDFERIKCK